MRICDVSIDVGVEGSEAYTVYIHNMKTEDFDKWAPHMENTRINSVSGRRSGHLNIGGLDLTIFEVGL
jgi:hypothetical protein